MYNIVLLHLYKTCAILHNSGISAEAQKEARWTSTHHSLSVLHEYEGVAMYSEGNGVVLMLIAVKMLVYSALRVFSIASLSHKMEITITMPVYTCSIE